MTLLRAKRSLTDALFETNFQTKVASELWLNLGGREYRLVGKVLRLGRALDNDIVLEDRSCSRYHAMISVTKDGYLLEDLKSRNGIRVNGKPVSKAYLKDNDEIHIGDLAGIFFVKSKSSAEQKFSREETGVVEGFQKIATTGNFENIKKKWETLPKNVRLGIIGIAPIFLFALFTAFSGNERSHPLMTATEEVSTLISRDEIVDQAVSKEAFNECLEFEDLGNLRKARACFSNLPLNEEVYTALNRVIKRQDQLAKTRYEEGQKAFDNYYFDMAILKWQEVLLIADDSSDLRAKAEDGIKDAEQRKLIR